jgi:hypothetical protein
MWITGDVDLPDEVLDAHERGDLVFFIGAGASLAKPSNLPLFDGLARALARRAAHPFSRRASLDFFVGSLESLPGGFNAHHHAREIIANPRSKFNALHSAIVDLAGVGGDFRVVTTNYDDHLTAAAVSSSIPIADTWFGPALPVGWDFSGLVHLHGSVRRSEREMILTDRDFGRAYITDAWAARFLLPMFDRFTVVFVGYSHDDVIMRYLALGLPSPKSSEMGRRFAITSDPQDPKWDYLGIRPIGYTAIGRNHGALTKAFEAWSNRSRMGQTDHRARVQTIVSGGTILPLPERDYLHSRLRTAEGARDFSIATAALPDPVKVDWLVWLEDLPEFRSLFTPKDVSEAAATLGNWFSRTFIASPVLHGAALQTVERIGQSMTNSLFRNASWAIEDLARDDSVAGERWLAFLATSIDGQSAPLRADALLPYLGESRPRSIVVLRTALRPLLHLKRRWFVGETESARMIPDAEVSWNAEEYALTQHLTLAVESAAAGDSALGAILQDSLIAAYDLLDAYQGQPGQDSLVHGRSSIAPHEQDGFRDPIDAIIDALRDYGLKALPTRPDLPNQWWATGRGLFQRLSLHLVSSDLSRAADEKVTWLLDHTDVYNFDLKHEIFEVLAAAVADASPALRDRVLVAAEIGPNYPVDLPDAERHLAYIKYNLLVWLTRCAPGWEAASAVLAGIQQDNPNFAPRDHPDFDTWMSGGTWGGTLPMATEEFVHALESNVTDALRDLLNRDYSERDFDQPTWRDSLELVEKSIGARPDLGISLWDHINRGQKPDNQGDELQRAITEGWAKADLGPSAQAAIERIGQLVGDAESARPIARFLLGQVRQKIDADESPVLSSMRNLARRLWDEQSGRFSHRPDSDPLSFAPLYLNSWPGSVAQYWSHEVDRRWRNHRDDWMGLTDEESEALTQMLAGNRDALDAAQPAICSELFFFFSADPTFTVQNILPLFSDNSSSRFAWYSYLHHPRYDDRLLSAGMLTSLITEWDRLDGLSGPEVRGNFFGLVASIVTYAGIDTRARRELLTQSVLARDGAFAADFARRTVDFLAANGVDGGGAWKHWLRQHLSDRLNGRPRTASPEELERWADVIPHLGSEIPAAVKLIEGEKIGIGDHLLASELTDEVLASHGAILVQYYADRIRNTTPTPTNQIVAYQLRELIERLRIALGDDAIQALSRIATERGFV